MSDGPIARTSARLRDLWAADRPAFGLWSTLADPAGHVCNGQTLPWRRA